MSGKRGGNIEKEAAHSRSADAHGGQEGTEGRFTGMGLAVGSATNHSMGPGHQNRLSWQDIALV